MRKVRFSVYTFSVPTAFTLRPACPADASALVALQAEIYRESLWFVGDGPPSAEAMTRRLRALEPHRGLYLLAVRGGQLGGWLELRRLQPRRLAHVAVLTLAVAKRWRRRGLGSRLLGDAYPWAGQVGVEKLQLSVRAGNRAAIALYEAQGFVLEGREVRQVRTAEGYEDNLLMAKFLPGSG